APAADDLGLRRVGDIDHREDVVGELGEVDRRVRVAAAGVPDAVRPDALDRQKPDFARPVAAGDIERANAGGEAARSPLQLVGRGRAEKVLLVLELPAWPPPPAVCL